MKTFFGFAIADSMFPAECTIRRTSLSVGTAKAWIETAIPCLNRSHQATIQAMESRFGIHVDIPKDPPQVALESGDALIVMGVRGLPRMTDRHEYTAEEIAGATFQFALYEVN